MLFMASNLTCRQGTDYFRARVPAHLVSAYGRSIVSVSLRTRDPSTVKARASLKRVELERGLSLGDKAALPEALQQREQPRRPQAIERTGVRGTLQFPGVSSPARVEHWTDKDLCFDSLSSSVWAPILS